MPGSSLSSGKKAQIPRTSWRGGREADTAAFVRLVCTEPQGLSLGFPQVTGLEPGVEVRRGDAISFGK